MAIVIDESRTQRTRITRARPAILPLPGVRASFKPFFGELGGIKARSDLLRVILVGLGQKRDATEQAKECCQIFFQVRGWWRLGCPGEGENVMWEMTWTE